MIVMLNFNNERLMMAQQATRYSRLCLEDAIQYAQVRKTFGKPLIKHQVIRHKLAEMMRQIESCQCMIDYGAYQTQQGVNPVSVGRFTAMMKVHCTRTMEFCAREASQIFGGASYLRQGPGARVERIYREVRVMAIGGGSEEVMNDLVVRASRL